MQILLPLNLPRKKLFFHFLCQVWLRTPDPATAFPNLILVQNEPPLVALTEPRAHSLASARFWSVSNGQRTEPRAHSPASAPKRGGQYGRTIGRNQTFLSSHRRAQSRTVIVKHNAKPRQRIYPNHNPKKENPPRQARSHTRQHMAAHWIRRCRGQIVDVKSKTSKSRSTHARIVGAWS